MQPPRQTTADTSAGEDAGSQDVSALLGRLHGLLIRTAEGAADASATQDRAWHALAGPMSDFMHAGDVFRLRAASRSTNAAFACDEVWRRLAMRLGVVAPPIWTPSWRSRFVAAAARRAVRLDGKVSVYNRAYHCILLEAAFSRDGLALRIHESSDGSMGPIQPPEASSLLLTLPAVRFAAPQTLVLQPVRCDLTEYTSTHAVGWLHFPPAALRLGVRVSFRYGTFGYGIVALFETDAAFVEAHHLRHLLH